MKYQKEFKSTYLNKLNIVIEKNYTDEIFHIKLNDNRETKNQIYFNKEDAKKIIEALEEMLKA